MPTVVQSQGLGLSQDVAACSAFPMALSSHALTASQDADLRTATVRPQHGVAVLPDLGASSASPTSRPGQAGPSHVEERDVFEIRATSKQAVEVIDLCDDSPEKPRMPVYNHALMRTHACTHTRHALDHAYARVRTCVRLCRLSRGLLKATTRHSQRHCRMPSTRVALAACGRCSKTTKPSR